MISMPTIIPQMVPGELYRMKSKGFPDGFDGWNCLLEEVWSILNEVRADVYVSDARAFSDGMSIIVSMSSRDRLSRLSYGYYVNSDTLNSISEDSGATTRKVLSRYVVELVLLEPSEWRANAVPGVVCWMPGVPENRRF